MSRFIDAEASEGDDEEWEEGSFRRNVGEVDEEDYGDEFDDYEDDGFIVKDSEVGRSSRAHYALREELEHKEEEEMERLAARALPPHLNLLCVPLSVLPPHLGVSLRLCQSRTT